MKNKLFFALLAVGLVFTLFGNRADAQSAKKVIVDAGHGGSDSGATGNGLREKDLTLKIAQKINQNLLNNYVVQTKMTRTSDVYISLNQRTNMANSWGANLFLSVHINAAGGSGYEDYIHDKNATSEDIKVQNEVNKEISKVLEEYGKNNRGKKKANFHVLRESKMASILLEILFIDNESDAALLKNEEFLNDISEAISTGVANALALPEKGNVGGGTSNENNSNTEEITVSKATGTYIVTSDSLNVRTGDGTNYPTIGTLKKNEEINVTGVTPKKWYQFTYKGKTGFVSGAYLKAKPASEPAPPTNQIKVSKASGTFIVTADSLNVRSGDSTKYNSLGSLKKNEQVTVTGKTSNNWYQIKFKGKTGYVNGAYLKAKPASKPTSTTNQIKVAKASGTFIVTANSLNVRSGNTAAYSSLGSLKKNQQVTVTGKTSNNWYQIKFKGTTGYVNGAYLKAKPASKPTSTTNQIKVSKASGTFIVTADSLNVRSGNTAAYSSLGALKKNEQVSVTGKTSNNWYQIKFKGKNGFVNGAYLKAKPASKPTSTTNQIKVAKASGTFIVTANSLNVRSGNTTAYSSLGSLKKNQQVSVTGKTSNNWYQIKFKGKNGFVNGAYLEAKPASKPAPQTNQIKVAKASGTYKVTANTLNVRSGNTASHSKIGSLTRGNKVKVTGKTSNGWYRINFKGKIGFVSGQYLKR